MTADTNTFIEVLRVVASMMGAAIALTLLFLFKDWRSLPYDRPHKMRFVALMLYGLLSCVQEAEQIGQPFLVWRLPLILVASTLALYGLYADGVTKNFKVSDRPEPVIMDWGKSMDEAAQVREDEKN